MAQRDEAPDAHVEAVRAFNRFYTRQIGLLEEGLLKSEFSLSEVRVMYELAHRARPLAAEICRDLDLDPGYLSRILKKFEGRGYLVRSPCERDGRQFVLELTADGRAAFEPLNKASRDRTADMLGGLLPEDRDKLVAAMKMIERLLGEADAQMVPYILRGPHPGDIGWVIHRQGVLYHQEYGWDETFEGLVAEIAGRFAGSCDPKRERCWIAGRDGEIVGSVFLMRETDEVAKLRLLYVDPSARRLGIGRRLVDECICFARAKGYKTLTLWTNDVLVSARRIYEAAGFRLVAEEAHHSFGQDLVGQTWTLDL